MSGDWRELLYPLGFLAAAAFSGRMLLQWLTSEVRKESTVMPLFWKLSLCGNLLLVVHSLIQVQFHVCAIQTCNAVISWRNLNLMQPVENRFSTRRTIQLMIAAICLISLTFALQGHFLIGEGNEWFRIPVAPWQSHNVVSFSTAWHLFGFVGLMLFSSRFWIQWWYAEKKQTSYLGAPFWWASLIGESICLVYFFTIGDSVNYIGPLVALVPYIRNLMLLYPKKQDNLLKPQTESSAKSNN